MLWSMAGSNVEHSTQAQGSTWHCSAGTGQRWGGEGREGSPPGLQGVLGRGELADGARCSFCKGQGELQSANSTAEEHPAPQSTFAKGSRAQGRWVMQPRPTVLGKPLTPFP